MPAAAAKTRNVPKLSYPENFHSTFPLLENTKTSPHCVGQTFPSRPVVHKTAVQTGESMQGHGASSKRRNKSGDTERSRAGNPLNRGGYRRSPSAELRTDAVYVSR
ncbi:hypothetical protein KM043_004144 [Ampulex compressa]|nr:hypothetical protein KM043_004144 [Ampulex compressa]